MKVHIHLLSDEVPRAVRHATPWNFELRVEGYGVISYATMTGCFSHPGIRVRP